MEQTYSKYPFFGKGELLTSDSLNNSFGYNDEQTRLSRRYLSGFGIVEGLTYTFKSGVLTIHPGVGITPNGFMVKIEKDIEYTKAEIINESSRKYRLCTAKEKGNSLIKLTEDIKGYIIEIEASVQTTSSMHCTELSCDARATEKEVVFNAYLSSETCQSSNELKQVGSSFCNFKKMDGCISNINVLRTKTRRLFDENLDNVCTGLMALCNILNPDFSTEHNRKTLMALSCWGHLFTGGAQGLAAGLYKALKRYEDDWHSNMNAYPMYYLQYLENMTDAIRECIDYYNEFVTLYPIIGGKGSNLKDSIFLGKVGKGYKSSRYRSVFASAHNADLEARAKKLEFMIRRVVLMRKNFIGNNHFNGQIEFAWANPDSPLADRFIPYYFNKNAELSKYWRICAEQSGARYDDYGTSDENSVCDTRGGKRLFLQGCYKKNINEVYNKLVAYIEENHLDIDVVKVKLEKETLRTSKGKHKELYYSKILLDTIAKESYRKAFDGRSKGTEVYKSISSLRGDWDAYINSAVRNEEVKISDVKRINSALDIVNIVNYVDFLNMALPNTPNKIVWQAGKGKKRDSNVTALMALKSYYLKSYHPEYDAAEYLHGCPNGAKLLLFYFDDKLFFEAAVKK